MKLSASLLQAITLGVSITAVSASVTSCEKQKIKTNGQERMHEQPGTHPTCPTDPCPACGMG